jgi:hypothetical protein
MELNIAISRKQKVLLDFHQIIIYIEFRKDLAPG